VKNHYKILGVSRFADQDTIRHAFRAKVRSSHPDLGAGSSPEKFREAVEAYEILSDPGRRREYDQTLAPPHVARGEPLIPSQEGTAVQRHIYYESLAADPFRMIEDLLQDFNEYFETLFAAW
jgi:DnaJ-class molecular chaperone